MFKKKSILDVFTQISSDQEASKPDLCLRLWNHLNKPPEKVSDKVSEGKECDEAGSETVSQEVTYTLGRLIQGLGSPRAHIRKCYFSTLVALLSNCDATFGPVMLTHFKSLVDKHLSKFESKGEKGEVLAGRILAYGVAFRSKIFLNSSIELQQSIITEMLTKCKERSYLPLLTYSFLVDFLQKIDENTFKTVMWPVLINEILVNWPSQTLETLHCLLEVHNKYPQLLKRKSILSALHSHSILHEETIENVINMLTNVTSEERLKHPLYGKVGEILAQEENSELMSKFWMDVETVLHNSPTKLQQLAVLNIFSSLVQHLPVEKISDLLTMNFVDHLINSCKLTVGKPDKLCSTSKTTLQLVVSRATEKSDESTSISTYKILCKLLFESGHLLIDKITGLKIVFPCIAKLNSKYVRLIAKKCENVILNEKQKNVNVRWTFKDRCYATQLLARLISHPQSQDMDWKIKHLKFMLKYSLFSITAEGDGYISNELASVLKNSFFTALSHQLSHLENHRMVLISLVYYIDNMLKTDENELKTPLSDEASECWRKTMSKIQKIDLKINETAERKTVMYVFQTLFLQMALHLFVDAPVARDILKELNRCYKKEKNQFESVKNRKNEESVDANDFDPKWIDIAVELFLSLLSRDTFLLRQLISRIFPHFCPYLTAQASSQILEVLNPASGNNILIDENEESDVEESDVGDEEENENMEIEEDESDSNIEDDEDVEENAIEKTRRAIRDALAIAGSVTDTESIDLDDMDDEEGKRLDLALSEAFKSTQQKSQNKNKKQSASDRALTNFRIRVMDLVDIYINNDPSLALVLDSIPILFALLEFCIKNPHQKPLETRIRSTIKKIGNLKKCSNIDEVEENNVVDILKNLMNKGDRSAPIFLDLSFNISQCCTFLLKMGIQISKKKKESDTVHPLFDVIVAATEDFFLRRDCLLPLNLFENILLKISWTKNVKLCERIVSYAFNPTVRGFRKNQALTLLACFYKNTRLVTMLKDTKNEDYVSLEDNILSHTINLLNTLKSEKTQKLKPSFVCELFSLLCIIKSTKFCAEVQKWKKLAQLLESFLNNGSFSLNVSRKYFTKLCSLLNVSVTHKINDSRKRKRKESDELEESKKQSRVVKNGFLNNCNHSEDNDSEGSENAESTHKAKNENEVNKTVIKKKKSKRKTKEHFNSKKLRNETLANDVEVFNFSKNIMKPDLMI